MEGQGHVPHPDGGWDADGTFQNLGVSFWDPQKKGLCWGPPYLCQVSISSKVY